MSRLQQDLPVGMEVHVVFDQPQIVKTSLNLFVQTLGEAMVIVLAVSFLSASAGAQAPWWRCRSLWCWQ
jgi:multidrug efflux pump